MKPTKMHPTKTAYASARAAYDTIRAEHDLAVAAITAPNGSDACLDECAAIDARLGLWDAFRILCEAEVAMVEHVRSVMTTDRKVAARYAEIAPAFDRWQKVGPTLRSRMVAICYRFDA